MAKNIIITPAPGGGTYPSIDFQGATTGTIKLEVRDDGSLLISGATETNVLSLYDETANPVRVPSISLEDSNASHHLKIIAGSNLSANRTFTLSTGDAARALDISAADVTISAFGATIVDDADASAARTTLGVAIGTNVQAYSAVLTTYAGIDPSANVQTVLGAADFAAIRTALGLVIGTNVQAYDADLATWAGLTPSAYFQTLIDDADASTARGTLGLGTSATVNTGTSGATVPLLNGTNTWSAAQSIDVNAATQLTITRTDDGTSGAQMDFIHVSASPANNDAVMTIRSVGRDNGGNATVYGRIRSFITDPTDGSEDSSWTISGMIAGAETTLLSMAGATVTYLGNTLWHAGNDGTGSGLDADTVDGKNTGTSGNVIPLLDGANTWSAAQTFNYDAAGAVMLNIVSTAAGAVGPATQSFHNSASPAASDQLFKHTVLGKDSGGNNTVYAELISVLVDTTDGSEDGSWAITTAVAGSVATRLSVGAGVYHPSATGTDKGNNTLNFGTIYQNNAQVLDTGSLGTSGTKIPYLDGANTWSAAQTITVSSTGDVLTLISTDASATSGPGINLYRNSASPAASDILGTIIFTGKDSGGNITNFGDIIGVLVDPTNSSEDGALLFRSTIAGTLASRVWIGGGIYSEGVTGGDKGAGTANFTTIYQNNTALGTAAFVATGTSGATIPLLNGANTWSAKQIYTGAGSNSPRSSGTDAAFEVLNSAATQNWYFGVKDSDSNKLYIGRGHSGAQGVTPAISITTSDVVNFTAAPTFTDASTTRTNLGLGTSATVNTGTSGATIPLLNGANTWSAAQTISATAPLLTLTGTAGQLRQIRGQTAGASRWAVILGDTASESGSNVGSDFAIYKYNDAGSLVSAPFIITRSTGAAAFENNVSARDVYAARGDATGVIYLGNQSGGARYLYYDGSAYQMPGAQLSINGSTAWHAGNDGTGSGLDADLLDGLNSTAVGAGKQGIWIPAAAMGPRTTTGCAALATFESAASNYVNVPYLAFDTSTVEYAQFNLYANKQFGTTTVTFKAVWMHPSTTTNFGVAWELAGLARSDDDAVANAFGTAVAVTDTGGTTNDVYITSESSAITIGGTFAAEDFLTFQISRATGNGSDTMAVDAQLIGIMLYVTTTANTDV